MVATPNFEESRHELAWFEVLDKKRGAFAAEGLESAGQSQDERAPVFAGDDAEAMGEAARSGESIARPDLHARVAEAELVAPFEKERRFKGEVPGAAYKTQKVRRPGGIPALLVAVDSV